LPLRDYGLTLNLAVLFSSLHKTVINNCAVGYKASEEVLKVFAECNLQLMDDNKIDVSEWIRSTHRFDPELKNQGVFPRRVLNFDGTKIYRWLIGMQ